MKKWIFILVGLAVVFFLGTLKINFHKPALSQKVTYDRVTQAPLLTFSKIFDKMRCSIGDANANLQGYTAANGYENPGDCDCEGGGGGASLASEWNDCLGCLFVMFVEMYNTFTTEISSTGGVDPDTDSTATFTMSGATLAFVSEASSLTDYNRHVRITNTSGDIVCLNLHYSKDATDEEKVKAIMHLDNANCPDPSGMSDSESHAMAMIFDLNHTDVNIQTASFFHTGDYDTSGFDVTATAQQDDIFYMNIEVDESSGNPITQGWVIRVGQNEAWKYYVNGEDDARLLVASIDHSDPPDLTDANVDATGLTTQCVDDSGENAADADTTACDTAGYAFENFPLSVNDISGKDYPTWTAATLTVTVDADVEDYF